MPKTTQISAHLPEDDVAYIKRLAEENLRSFSAQLAMIVREYRADREPQSSKQRPAA